MTYLLLIIVGLGGVALGYYLAQRNRSGNGFIDRQTQVKAGNKEKILQFVRERGRIQNNDVEKLAGVSNATAERYLNELEKEGKLTQHGAIGQSVYYTLK